MRRRRRHRPAAVAQSAPVFEMRHSARAAAAAPGRRACRWRRCRRVRARPTLRAHGNRPQRADVRTSAQWPAAAQCPAVGRRSAAAARTAAALPGQPVAAARLRPLRRHPGALVAARARGSAARRMRATPPAGARAVPASGRPTAPATPVLPPAPAPRPAPPCCASGPSCRAPPRSRRSGLRIGQRAKSAPGPRQRRRRHGVAICAAGRCGR